MVYAGVFLHSEHNQLNEFQALLLVFFSLTIDPINCRHHFRHSSLFLGKVKVLDCLKFLPG